jgi:hypothetical protein
MPDYLLPCSCGQKTRVANAQAGGQVACVCGKSLAVPTLRGLRELDLAPPMKDAVQRAGWSRQQGTVFATGLLIAAVGLYMVAYYSWKYAQLTVQGSHLLVDRTQDVLKASSAEVGSLSPAKMLEEWNKEKEEGLGEKYTPIWVTAKATISQYVSRIQAGAVAAAAGVLVAAAAMFVGRRPGMVKS